MQHAAPVHRPRISTAQLTALIIATTVAGTVAAIGMLASFHTVSTQMQPSFKGWAWTVPVTLDMTIAAFSLLEFALLRMALPHTLARLAVYAATAATVYLNTRGLAPVDGAETQLIAHAAMPAVWALYIELLRSAAAALTRREREEAEHPILTLMLAPRAVLAAWRREILAHALPVQPCEPKMSTTRGHYSRPDQHDPEQYDPAVRESPDIFRAPPHDGPQAPTAHAEAACEPVNRQPRIGKGRGLTGRHAVLDLARRQPELSNAQLAERLNLSPRTVRRHLGQR